jgi:hypothetical protein
MSILHGYRHHTHMYNNATQYIISVWCSHHHTHTHTHTHNTHTHMYTNSTTVTRCSTGRISEKWLIYNKCRSHHRQIYTMSCMFVDHGISYIVDHVFTQEFLECQHNTNMRTWEVYKHFSVIHPDLTCIVKCTPIKILSLLR